MNQLIIRVNGGLGNQLFQYAFGYALARRLGRELRLDLTDFSVFKGRTYQLDHFKGPAATPRWSALRARLFFLAWAVDKRVSPRLAARLYAAQRVRVLRSDRLFDVDPLLQDHRLAEAREDLCVAGCYGLLPYFDERLDELRAAFAPAAPAEGRNAALLRELEASDSSVSLHVRRSDYLWASNGSPALDFGYYRNAVDTVRRRVPNPRWTVFSDDIPWCREAFAFLGGARFVDGNEEAPWEDLRLIAACRHHVLANSTFSQWGALLGRDPAGLTVYPQKWFRTLPTPAAMVRPDWLPAPSFEATDDAHA